MFIDDLTGFKVYPNGSNLAIKLASNNVDNSVDVAIYRHRIKCNTYSRWFLSNDRNSSQFTHHQMAVVMLAVARVYGTD